MLFLTPLLCECLIERLGELFPLGNLGSTGTSGVEQAAKKRGETVDLNPGEFRGMRLVDIAAMTNERNGIRPASRSPEDIVRAALEGHGQRGISPQGLQGIDDFPVIQLAVTGYDDAETVQAQLESSVIPDIEDVDGVDSAEVVGAIGQRITITPDDAELAAAGYTQQAITDALQTSGPGFILMKIGQGNASVPLLLDDPVTLGDTFTKWLESNIAR